MAVHSADKQDIHVQGRTDDPRGVDQDIVLAGEPDTQDAEECRDGFEYDEKGGIAFVRLYEEVVEHFSLVREQAKVRNNFGKRLLPHPGFCLRGKPCRFWAF